MVDELKEALLDLPLLPGEEVATEVALEEPPAAEEFCTCPECGCTGAEVWSGSDAYVANCPQCHLEFVPVLEGMKLKLVSMMERRRQRRKRPVSRSARRDLAIKDEIYNMMS